MPSVREDPPRFIPPMLAAGGPCPEGEAWAAEVKWDGIRAQLRVDGDWCVRSRPGRDCSDEFPELDSLAATLRGRRILLDGELVHLAGDGAPDFNKLRRRLIARGRAATRLAAEIPATFVAFDVLHLDGRSTRRLPYLERRGLLQDVLSDREGCRVPQHFIGEAPQLATATREHHLEGTVCKRIDGPYQPGRRAWLKHKHRRREVFTVTGYQPGEGQPDTIYLARSTETGLAPVGGVQYGLSADARKTLRAALEANALPPRHGRRIRNVPPLLRVAVDYHGRPGGALRDPVMRELLDA